MPVKDAFLAGILAHVPEADRGKAESTLEALEKDGLRQADYSKLANDAAAAKQRFDDLYTKNTEWFTEKQAALQELDSLREQVKKPVVVPEVKPGDLPADVIRKKDFDSTLDLMERGAVAVIAESNRLTAQHYKDFGEVLDLTPLLGDKRVQQIGLRGVYNDLYKDQLKARADKAEADRVDAIRKDERSKVQAEFANRQLQYPVIGNEPSALDGIEAARAGKAPTVATVDTMASEYARLSAVRSGVA